MRFAFETDVDRPALERFADRLREAGSPQAEWPLRFSWNRLPGTATDQEFSVRRRRFLSLEGDEVRGIVNFFEHQLWLAACREPIPFVWPNGMVTEGIIDRRYSTVAPSLLRAALARQPRQMIFGPIGTEAPMPRLLVALRWLHQPVPVFVLPVHTAKVARELRRLSRYPQLRTAGRAAAVIRLTFLLDLGLTGLRRLRRPRDVVVEDVEQFAGWSDAIWRGAKPFYGALTRRDGVTLDRLYRPRDPRLIRLKISSGRRPVGWIVLTVRDNHDDLDFGNLRTGLLADCLAPPGDAAAVVAAGVERLAAMGVDLILATFSHPAWIVQSRRIGFIPVPTTTRLFISPSLAPSLPPLSLFHLTRGDCDGPLPYDNAVEATSGYSQV